MNRHLLSLLLGLLLGIGGRSALAQTTPPVPAAQLSERDIRIINEAARKRLDLYSKTLNLLTDRENTEYDKKEMIAKLFLPGDEQVFESDLVLVDDDVDPNHVNADNVVQPNLHEYLEIFDLGYAKVSNTNTITFTPLLVQVPKQTGEKIFVKLYFRSIFKGRHKTIQKPYQPTERVMEMRAERVGNNWQVRVVRLGFTRPGENAPPPAQASPPVAGNGRPAIPDNLSINSPEVPFHQPDKGTAATLKVNRFWLEVVKSSNADVPLGFYQRRAEAYFFDDVTSIEFRDNSNQFLFRKGRDYQGFIRDVPIVSASRPANDPVRTTPPTNLPNEVAVAKPRPVAIRPDTTSRVVAATKKMPDPKQPDPKPAETALTRPLAQTATSPAVAAKPPAPKQPEPKPAETAVTKPPALTATNPVAAVTNAQPLPVYETKPPAPKQPARDTTRRTVAEAKKPVPVLALKPTPAKSTTTPASVPVSFPRPDTGRALAALSLPLKVSKPEPDKPALPAYEKKPPVKPDLNTALTADAKKEKARLRTLGTLQIAAGLAGLAGSYVGYSAIKKDYDAYTVKVDKLNTEYNTWRDLARKPTGEPLAPMSITSYGKPGIYGVYAGGGVSVLALVNGIRSLGKASKIKPKPAK